MRAKAEYYYERLQLSLNQELMIAPLSVEIDLSNVCHQACYYCNAAEYRSNNPDKATKQDYIRLISELPKKINDITFAGGGEPLDNAAASDIMNHALREGFKIGVITNGMRLRHLQFSKEYFPSWIGIDIDSGNEDDYRTIRKGSLQEVVSSIGDILSDLKLFGTKLTFKYLINDYNNSEEQLFEALYLARDIGFDEFYVRVAYFKDHVILPPVENWWKLEQIIRDKCDELGLRYIGNFAKQIDFVNMRANGNKYVHQCFAPLFLPVFTSDGSLYWCCEHRGEKEYIIGNWIEDDVKPLYRADLLNNMKKFALFHKCAHQCRYFNYNHFASKIAAGLADDDAGHTVGFF